MARTRSIKPGIVTNEDLCDLGMAAYILFTGLWMFADRAGRLEDRPKRIKAQVMPLWEGVSWREVDILLDKLTAAGFLRRYQAAERKCIEIVNWKKHQHPDPREAASELPASSQCKAGVNTSTTQCNYTESTPPLQSVATAPAPVASEQLDLTPLFAPDAKDGVITMSTQCVADGSSLTKRVGYGLWVMGYESSGGVVERGSGGEEESPAPPPMKIENEQGRENPGTPPLPISRKQPSLEMGAGSQRVTANDFPMPGQGNGAGEHMAGARAQERPVLSGTPNHQEATTFDPQYIANLNYLAGSLLELAPLVHLPNPDDDMLRQILAAGQGATGEEIAHLLAALYKRGRLNAMRSWGFLPVLIRQWATAA